MQSVDKQPKWMHYVIMFAIAVIPFLSLGAYVVIKFDTLFEDKIIQFIMTHLPKEEKEKVYTLIARKSLGMYDTVPEPLVGRTLQRNRTIYGKTAIFLNNAGMRSRDQYTTKAKDKYRIICLGDSFVFGHDVNEDDRLGNQIEKILEELDATVNGKRVEVYSVGVPSWTSVNEATYLSSRMSDYEPDLVFALMLYNDIGDGEGVLGIGCSTSQFSPEYRNHGSAVFSCSLPSLFNVSLESLLWNDLGPESRIRWEKAFAAWKRLEVLLEKSNGRMILGISSMDPLFIELCKFFHERSDMRSPLIFTNCFEHRNLEDPHPNREGHRVIGLHYLHTAADLGWLPIKAEDLPPLDSRLSMETEHSPDPDKMHILKEERIRECLDEEISFDNIKPNNARAFLGGIFPENEEQPLKNYPCGSLKSCFLLKQKRNAKNVLLEIDVPPQVELFPYSLQMHLNGHPAAELNLTSNEDSGRHILEGTIPKTQEFDSTIEVLLLTQSYWTTINNPGMKSFYLIKAWQE